MRLAASNEHAGTDHTGEIISFSDVGYGTVDLPRAWYCYTNNPGGVKWLFPDGSSVPIFTGPGRNAVGEELFITSAAGAPGAVILARGPDHFSPDGEHCCVRNNDNTHRICVTFSEC